jgi:hypothetical protein
MSQSQQRPKIGEYQTPEWTPSPQSSTALIRVEGFEAADINGQRVTAMVSDPDGQGHRVEASVPHAPYERWLTSTGVIVNVPIKTTRVLTPRGSSVDEGNYADSTRAACLRAGWLPWESGPYGEDRETWIARRDVVQAEWKRDHTAQQRDSDKRFLDSMQHNLRGMVDDIRSAFENLADGAKDRAERAARTRAPKTNPGEV